ncbi:leucine-rich repeat domain-containing protein [Schlesneria paludicola]|uniref:leucine-rich repeat domain-containing protein n=1 Tax=Schlesneria paludicola TaxID=360056 RepID=UPI00029A1F83|nr:leucine-rich repeat domain-containing protein [Schlesneria paludicola]
MILGPEGSQVFVRETAGIRHADVGLQLQLGPEPELQFTRKAGDSPYLYVTTPGQQAKLVGVKIPTKYSEDDESWTDPLSTLSDAEINGLWGLELNFWSDEIAKRLSHINGKRTCVTINDGVLSTFDKQEQRPTDARLPPLPYDIEDLVIASSMQHGFKDFASLRHLTKLRSLMVRDADFDCEALSKSFDIRALLFSNCTLINGNSLKSLLHVQVLNIDFCQELTDLSFLPSMVRLESLSVAYTPVITCPAAGLNELKTLNISGTAISDLSPLNGLPKLERIDARLSSLTKLPQTLPKLKFFNSIASELTESEVSEFRKRNPACEMLNGWNHSFQMLLTPATRLRIRVRGPLKGGEPIGIALLELRDKPELKQLISNIRLTETDRGAACFCFGSVVLDFFTDESHIAKISVHHGSHLRWGAVWPGDANLTRESREFLVAWLADRNVWEPHRDLRDAEKQDREADTDADLIRASLPSSLAKALDFADGVASIHDTFQATLKKEFPKEVSQIEILLRMLGTGNTRWDSPGFFRAVAREQLRTYHHSDLQLAVGNAFDGPDRQMRRGAARLWKDADISKEQWGSKRQPEWNRMTVQIEQEARSSSVRIEALEDLLSWKKDFTDDEFQRRLDTGLHDPEHQVRRQAMLIAGRAQNQESISLLMTILKGGTIETWALPEAPPNESSNLGKYFEVIAPDCSDAEVAGLALAYLRHQPAKALIESANPQTGMHQLSMALLGDEHQLKHEHFEPENNNDALRLAAFEAAIRSRGRYHLQSAILVRAKSSQDEQLIATKLNDMLRAENAPGIDSLPQAPNVGALWQWYHRFGAEYLKRFDNLPEAKTGDLK